MVLAIDNFLTADSGSSVRVPFLGLGIKPFGPRVLAKGSNLGMVDGVAIRISKLTLPSFISAKIVSLRITTFLLTVSRWGKVEN